MLREHTLGHNEVRDVAVGILSEVVLAVAVVVVVEGVDACEHVEERDSQREDVC